MAWGCRAAAAVGAVAITAATAVLPFTSAGAMMIMPETQGLQALLAARVVDAAAAADAGARQARPPGIDASDAKGTRALNSHHAVVSALMKGQGVAVILDLAACRNDADGRPGPPVRGGTRIGAFLITRDQTLAFSEAHATVHETPADTSASAGTSTGAGTGTSTGIGAYIAATEFLRYRFTPDGIVKLHITERSDAPGNAVRFKAAYRCQVGHGVKFLPAAR